MSSISGFWAGVYTYNLPNYPAVKFDCEITQTGSVISGIVTEIDIYKPSRFYLLESTLDGHIEKRTVSFTKTYLIPSNIYNEPVEYSGKANLKGTKITGKWYIGETSGSFTLTRDKGQILITRQHRAANDLQNA